MDGGKMAEFDEPSKLLQNKQSIFYSMARAMGDQEFDQLLSDKFTNEWKTYRYKEYTDSNFIIIIVKNKQMNHWVCVFYMLNLDKMLSVFNLFIFVSGHCLHKS